MLSWVPNWARWEFPLVIVVAVVAFVIWPQLDEAESAWDAARRIDPWLLLAATGLQAASFASQAQLTRVVVSAACRPTFATMGRVELATMAVSHTVPRGTAAGTAVAYRLLTHGYRVPTADAGFASRSAASVLPSCSTYLVAGPGRLDPDARLRAVVHPGRRPRRPADRGLPPSCCCSCGTSSAPSAS